MSEQQDRLTRALNSAATMIEQIMGEPVGYLLVARPFKGDARLTSITNLTDDCGNALLEDLIELRESKEFDELPLPTTM